MSSLSSCFGIKFQESPCRFVQSTLKKPLSCLMPHTNILSVNNLHCIRGERELFRSLNTQVVAGQCLHIVGANGSGKTSLLRIISGLNTPDDGHVLWNDAPIRNNSDYLNDSAFIGHKDALKNELSAIENLRFYQHLNTHADSSGNRNKEQQLDDCLMQLQILECADLLAQQLSFGQRRRLAFAKLLLRHYKIWILDEPFTGIDVQGRAVIESLCIKHLKNGGAIILTHHQSLQGSAFKEFLCELQLDHSKPSLQGKPNE